jgi:hypothetical protein
MTCRGQREPGRQAGRQEADVPLELGRQPRARADGHPPATVLAEQQLDDEQQRYAPEQEIRGGRGQQVHGAQELGTGRGGQRGEDLAGGAGAEQAAHRGGQRDQRGHHQRRDQAQGEQRVARHGGGEAGQQRGEGRLVDVAERRVLAGGQEVQLITVISVPGAHRHLDGERDGGDQGDPADGGGGRGARGAGL